MTTGKQVCTQCGYIGNPKSAVKGSILIEIILWLFFIIPGLIYSIWRLSSKSSVCPKCGNPSLIPLDSPRAQKILEENMSKEEITKTVEFEIKKDFKEKKRNTIITVILIVVIVVVFIFLSSLK